MRDSLGSVVQGVGLVKDPRPEAIGVRSGDFASPRVCRQTDGGLVMSRRAIAKANWAWLMSGIVLVAVGATMLWASSASLTRVPDATAASLRGAACKWYDSYARGCNTGGCAEREYLYQLDQWYTWAEYYGEGLINNLCDAEKPTCGYWQQVEPCTF